MISFTRSLKYQFSLFAGPPGYDVTTQEASGRVREILERPHNTTNMGLKLRDPAHQPAIEFMQPGVGQLAIPTTVWGGDIWTAALNPMRLDVAFDAVAYANARDLDTPPEIAEVVRRLVVGLDELLGINPISRVALIFKGESNLELPEATEIVARQFFSDKLRKAAHEGDVADATARLNLVTMWELPQLEVPIGINRIETGAAQWVLVDGKQQTWLSWQFDVNTSPLSDVLFTKEQIAAFFAKAENWMKERLALLSEGRE